MTKPENILKNQEIKTIHCIGIGGIGVSGLAEMLLQKGYQVTGSDVANNANTKRLQKLGIKFTDFHAEDNIRGADAIIHSSAIGQGNPELTAAIAAKLPILTRGQLLAELFNEKFGIAVAGTHGKTTTSSLLSSTLLHAGLDPTYVIGGVLNQNGSPMYIGQSDYFVAESDESDASFLYLKPKMIIITNIDRDHLQTYGDDFEQLKQAFLKFIHNLPEDGLVVLCIDNQIVESLIPHIERKILTYGFNKNADYCVTEYFPEGAKSAFTVCYKDQQFKTFVKFPGKHNVLNATAVIALANYLNIDQEKIYEGLEHFAGVGRRFQYHGQLVLTRGNAEVFEDYGHHPSEIEATIEAAKEAWPTRRLVMVFQPHRYTRTRDLLNEFATVLAKVDCLFLLDIYSAGEEKIPGITAEKLQQLIVDASGNSTLILETNTLLDRLRQQLQDSDIILFQGAGSVGQMAKLFVKE